MKIVQSFWSKPMTLGTDRILRNGGWYNKRLFLYGTTLSILLLNRHYPDKTVFVTDKFGKELFIDKLQLPFGEVIVELDELNFATETLWALGKIHTYSIMREKFIHFDLDFFLRNPLPKNILEAPLVAYTSEFSEKKQYNIYVPHIEKFLRTFPRMEGKIRYFCEHNERKAYNAGIFGGEHLDIFEEMKNIAFDALKKNTSIINNNDCYFFNVIFEQFVFTCLAREKKYNVVCLLEEDAVMYSQKYTNMKYFSIATSVHLMGEGKYKESSCTTIEHIMFNEFPDYYYRINNLLYENRI